MYATNLLTPHLDPLGLIVLGSFHPAPEDGVPGDPGTCVLVGNAGPAMWHAFSLQRSPSGDPLDTWIRTEISAIAATLDATPLFPFGGPPYLPFQRWAQKAAPVAPSPLGMLVHPDFGLWHAYRAALAFFERLEFPPVEWRPSPCDACADKPCLSGCPVAAFSAADGYNVPACTTHLATQQGTDCNDLGCRARRACPVGREFVYEPEQAAFHMAAFRCAQGG